jgi:hypothetical protein
LRKFVSLKFAFTLLFFASIFLVSIGHAQETQVDLAGGGNILWSPQNNTASEAFLPPAEKGGIYPSGFFQYLNKRDRGINIEGAFLYHEGLYNDFQFYRPILIDANGVYSRRLAPKTHGDMMAGAGIQSVLFYGVRSCPLSAGGCSTNINSNHFLFHAGFGVRYYAWRNLFVRPEAHYYFIVNNHEFHSDNVFRVGVSVGWTWGHH